MLKNLILILLFTIFIVVYPPLFDYFELPKVLTFVIIFPIVMTYYVVSTSFKVTASNEIFQELKQLPNIFWLQIFFVVAAIYSSIQAFSPTSFWGQPYRYQGIIFFTFLTGFSYVLSRHYLYGLSLVTLRRTLVVAGMFNICIILVQGTLTALGIEVYTFHGRMTGLIGNPNFAGGVIALIYPYIFYELQANKMVLFIATCAASAAVFFTDSRGALIGLGLAVVLLFSKYLTVKKLLILIILLPIIGIYFFPRREASNFDSRTIIWQKGWQAAQQKPLFGWGLENFNTAFQAQLLPEGDFDLKKIRVDKAHNEFLEILVSTGIVGCSLYIAVLAKTALILWREKKKNSFAHLHFVTLMVFIVLAQVNVLSITEYIFLYIAIAVAASDLRQHLTTKTTQPKSSTPG